MLKAVPVRIFGNRRMATILTNVMRRSLDDLDSDEFGLMTKAAALLLERGWVPLLDD